MSNIYRGLAWAALILAVALAGNFGLVDKDVVSTLVIVLPVLAVVTLRNDSRCRLPRREA